MFDKDSFADLLSKAIGDRTTTDYADLTGVNRTYISKLLNKKLLNPPSPSIIKGLASNAYHNISYEDLMMAAGYLPNTYTSTDISNIEEFMREHKIPEDIVPEKSLLRSFKNFIKDDSGMQTTSVPLLQHLALPILPFVLAFAGIKKLIPKLELADVLEEKEVVITEGGEPIDQEKRNKLVKIIRNSDSVSIKTQIPILGTIRAGLPVLAEDHWEEEIEVPSTLKADFALRVTGDSMLYVGIHPGYIAVFRKSDNAQSGQVVAAGVESMEWEANLKFYIERNGQAVLRSANPDYEDIEFGPKHRIIGVMVGLFRDNSPSIIDYQNMLRVKENQDDRWSKVIETASANGITPEHVRQLIDMQLIMAQKLTP